MSDTTFHNNEKEKQSPMGDHGVLSHDNEKAKVEHHNDVLADNEILNEAYRAENFEHELSMWEAAKTHPKACFWAFIMAFTIVSG